MSSRKREVSSFRSSGGSGGALRMLLVRIRLTQSAARFGIQGSTTALRPRLVRKDSSARLAGTPADVVGGLEIGHDRGIDREEAVDRLHGVHRAPLEVVEEEDVDPVAGEGLVIARELGVVPAHVHPT